MGRYLNVCFDLDRTLWDFEANSRAALHDLYLNCPRVAEKAAFETFCENFHTRTEKLWVLLKKGYIGKHELRRERFIQTLFSLGIRDHELAGDLNQAYMESCPQKTSLMEGSLDLLEYLRGKSYVLSILSNGFTATQEEKLRNCGLDSYFQYVITSETAGYTKPNPQFFGYACAMLQADKSDCLMIGDDWSTDIVGARSAGIDQVWFNPKQAPLPGPVTFEIQHLGELKEIL